VQIFRKGNRRDIVESSLSQCKGKDPVDVDLLTHGFRKGHASSLGSIIFHCIFFHSSEENLVVLCEHNREGDIM
jgi:hypothetical protein